MNSYPNYKETVLKAECCILTDDFTIEIHQRKEDDSVKDGKQKRRKRIYFEVQIWRNFKIKIYYCASEKYWKYFRERNFWTLQHDTSCRTS